MLRSISLDGNLEQLSDASWRSIMAENPLQNLQAYKNIFLFFPQNCLWLSMCKQTVWFNTSTKMSMASIHRLLEDCPKWGHRSWSLNHSAMKSNVLHILMVHNLVKKISWKKTKSIFSVCKEWVGWSTWWNTQEEQGETIWLRFSAPFLWCLLLCKLLWIMKVPCLYSFCIFSC